MQFGMKAWVYTLISPPSKFKETWLGIESTKTIIEQTGTESMSPSLVIEVF